MLYQLGQSVSIDSMSQSRISTANWFIVAVTPGKTFSVKVADNEEDFFKTTIKQLKKKISEKSSGMMDADFIRVIFTGKELEDKKTLWEPSGIITYH